MMKKNGLTQFVLAMSLVLTINISVAASEKTVADHYTVIAHAVFEDALITATELKQTINTFVKKPNHNTLATAKTAWKAARIPYQQSEVFRFGNANVDDWEGQLNAWPLDEGLIDYVAPSYEHELGNPGATANIIANTSIQIGGKKIDLTSITPELLASLNELSGSEANVATGYHAIEFLLWGQDLNGTDSGAGKRSYTDFAKGKQCTNGNCGRRAQYLQATIELLITDLEIMVGQWAPGKTNNYRARFIALPTKTALTKMLYGMGSLSLGELAGERMKVALEANSPEDEHDCFSDNTHYSHFYNAKGVRNIYLGEYQRVNGKKIKGLSISALVETKDSALDDKMKNALVATEKQLQFMVDVAEGKEPSANKKEPMKFDQMVAPANKKGEKIVRDSIASLLAQTVLIEQVAAVVGVTNLNPDTADHQFN
ncbi:MAG: putative iron-regulated protein [Cellvibrionaceae bacterium]|jgi:putative iron-regulated protein